MNAMSNAEVQTPVANDKPSRLTWDEKVKLVIESKASSLTQAEFCAANGITTSSLGYWITQYNKKQRQRTAMDKIDNFKAKHLPEAQSQVTKVAQHTDRERVLEERVHELEEELANVKSKNKSLHKVVEVLGFQLGGGEE